MSEPEGSAHCWHQGLIENPHALVRRCCRCNALQQQIEWLRAKPDHGPFQFLGGSQDFKHMIEWLPLTGPCPNPDRVS